MERLSDTAIEIINDLHTERLEYTSEYIPLIDSANKLAEYEDLEEQGLLLRLPESDWNDLIKQLATIVANDFIVYSDEREFIANQFFSLEYDEELRFTATCRCFNGTENDWWCDEECNCSDDGHGCYINFCFSDIGKTVFLTKEEAEAGLREMEVGE